ncbi:MAG: Gfo/Idh/MocA family oxidoreductase [Fimbriimonadaceae bacterium]|nr:Gfo/Idh/MocA family oxidoreductase [Fimbriimonadaceae bacterium]
MALRIGFVGIVHMHSYSYANCVNSHADTECVGVWDRDPDAAKKFAEFAKCPVFSSAEEVIGLSDAIIVCSANNHHADDVVAAAKAGKHVLCEKPLAATLEDAQRILDAEKEFGVKVMTAFPCRYSPAFQKLLQRVKNGDIGEIQAICATNRGSNPGGWFVEKELSGGGAMIDHTVHVADLLYVLLGHEPVRVQAQIGNNMYSQSWEDTAMVTLEYANGVFVTLDSSWSRPKSYKTWGDVTMNVVGDKGVIELDMFNQAFDVYRNSNMRHGLAGYGSGTDDGLVNDFVNAIKNDTPMPISAEDGWRAAKIAVAGYRSVAEGQPVVP